MLSRFTQRAAIAIVSACAATAAFAADDQIVKPAPAAAPKAGPTVSAASEFCGAPTAKAEQLIKTYSSDAKLQEVYKSSDYVAYSDDPKNASIMYTFTVAGHPAHPAAVCRRLTREGDNLVIKMTVVCDGAADACAQLKNDFSVMTAKMQADVDQKLKSKQ